MIDQVQGALSKSMGVITSTGSSIKALAGSHPLTVGVLIGIGAYYAVNKLWLGADQGEAEKVTEKNKSADAK